jgi:hypothetical protein
LQSASPLPCIPTVIWTVPAPLHERALAIREVRLVPDHPDTLQNRHRGAPDGGDATDRQDRAIRLGSAVVCAWADGKQDLRQRPPARRRPAVEQLGGCPPDPGSLEMEERLRDREPEFRPKRGEYSKEDQRGAQRDESRGRTALVLQGTPNLPQHSPASPSEGPMWIIVHALDGVTVVRLSSQLGFIRITVRLGRHRGTTPPPLVGPTSLARMVRVMQAADLAEHLGGGDGAPTAARRPAAPAACGAGGRG